MGFKNPPCMFIWSCTFIYFCQIPKIRYKRSESQAHEPHKCHFGLQLISKIWAGNIEQKYYLQWTLWAKITKKLVINGINWATWAHFDQITLCRLTGLEPGPRLRARPGEFRKILKLWIIFIFLFKRRFRCLLLFFLQVSQLK